MTETEQEPAFEPFHLERETKPDGRAILFYSWPDGPPVPEGLGNVARDTGGMDVEGAAPESEPWSPETQPTEELGRDV